VAISKAIIPAGGYGTRFLPITKVIPKEMLPIGDKPVIHYIIDELFSAGITEILILIGANRECLVEYLSEFPGITFKRVPHARGVADNIRHAKQFTKDEPFIVAFSDNVFFNGNPTKEMLEDYNHKKLPVICATEVPKSDANKYGIITQKNNYVIKINEKPANPKSGLAGFGRFILSPDIFDLINDNNEKPCLSETLNKLDKLRVIKTKAIAFDTGSKEGLFKASSFSFCPS